MRKTVTATEANRQFAKILAEVKHGVRYTVTSHGQPVAKIVAYDQFDRRADDSEETARREEAKKELLDRLEAQPAMNLGKVTRDEMHER